MFAAQVKKLIVGLSLGLFSVSALAAPGDRFSPNVGATYHSALSKTFGAVMPNPSPEVKQTIFDELLSSNQASLTWPNFPRSWVQKDYKTYIETNTSTGMKLQFNIPMTDRGFAAGHKLSVAYQYSTKISFVAITTMNTVPANGRAVSTGPLQGNQLESVRYFDPRTQKNYFRVSETNPMVGFCVFEMQLNIAKNNDSTVSFVVGDGTLTNSEIWTETQAVYSKFFQIESHVPEMDYLHVKCQEHFQTMVRPYVENDFSKVITEYFTFWHPQNQCVVTGRSDANGDEDCAHMHSQQHPNVKASTVARCEQGGDGVSRCVLKSKKGKSCPLFWDDNGRLVENQTSWKGSLPFIGSATFNIDAYPCDRGSRCRMNPKEGPLAFLFADTASCR